METPLMPSNPGLPLISDNQEEKNWDKNKKTAQNAYHSLVLHDAM